MVGLILHGDLDVQFSCQLFERAIDRATQFFGIPLADSNDDKDLVGATGKGFAFGGFGVIFPKVA